MERTTDNPFGGFDDAEKKLGSSGINDWVRDSVKEAKNKTMDGVGLDSMFRTAESLNRQAKMARRNKDRAWEDRIRGYARDLLAIATRFAKEAVRLALSKLVLELCAMVINHIMDLLKSGGHKDMDITTPHVFYGRPAPQSGPSQPSLFGSDNPFNSGGFGSSSLLNRGVSNY